MQRRNLQFRILPFVLLEDMLMLNRSNPFVLNFEAIGMLPLALCECQYFCHECKE